MGFGVVFFGVVDFGVVDFGVVVVVGFGVVGGSVPGHIFCILILNNVFLATVAGQSLPRQFKLPKIFIFRSFSTTDIPYNITSPADALDVNNRQGKKETKMGRGM